jgi:hypothetical protein
MVNSEFSTANVSSQSSSELDSLAAQWDLQFALQMAEGDIKGTPIPEVTQHMLEQAELFARSCGLDIHFRKAPEGESGKRDFAGLVHELYSRAEARWVGYD